MTSLRYVTEGYGLLLTPSTSFHHLLENDQLHILEVVFPELWRDVYIKVRADRPNTNLIRAAKELIREVQHSEVLAGHWLGVSTQSGGD